MEKIYSVLIGVLFLLYSDCAKAQSFTVQQDTVRYSYIGNGVANIYDYINNPSIVVSDSVQLSWKVILSDFPSDWQSATGICDNSICYGYSMCYPSMATKISGKYPDGLGDFHVQTALTTVYPSTV